MKKILCVMMVALLLIGTSLAEGGLTLHNGTKFGMAVDEVMELERNNGWTFKKESNESSDFPTSTVLLGEGMIANQPETTVRYYFTQNDNTLYEMFYYFESVDTFAFIEKSLIEKYGTTEYSSETGLKLSGLMTTSNEDFLNQQSRSNGKGGYTDREVTQYSQRLIETDDNRFVLIYHYNKKTTSKNSYSGQQYGPYFSQGLYYILLTSEQIESFSEFLSYSDDL